MFSGSRMIGGRDTGCDLVGKPKATRAKQVDLNPHQAKWFTKHGWTFERTEFYDHLTRRKHDVWTFGDYLACKPGEGMVLVQVTTDSNAAARIKKARAAPPLKVWLECGGRFQVHQWGQPKGPGTLWVIRRREITMNTEAWIE